MPAVKRQGAREMRSLNRLHEQHFHWGWPPSDPVLSDEDVHVWVANLEQGEREIEELTATLSIDEQARAARFHFKRDRCHFSAARGYLRQILCRYTGIPPQDIQFTYGKNGKPGLPSSASNSITFNLSHSGGLAVYAISKDRELGIDLEKIAYCSNLSEIAARCFTLEEQRMLKILHPPERETTFFRFWTRKEAELKCGGIGFSDEEITPFTGSIVELDPAVGYIAALATKGKPFKLLTWQWPTPWTQSIPA